ncbi:hypothetical protein DPMN_111136 [Dreissena polymorpha]|uniref:Uncharacterized protein n=1 Tax=Dreissena polymorpha TaxID=45954 RepID=A0A9D4QPL0_DREPO|nr:hypothetical protein DPMN_111136 [Dreissena polymorpha]
MSGGGRGQGSVHEVQGDMSRHRFSTSAKKATSTPPKRKDFMSPSEWNVCSLSCLYLQLILLQMNTYFIVGSLQFSISTCFNAADIY